MAPSTLGRCPQVVPVEGNDSILAFAAHEIIERFGDRRGDGITGLRFNKMLSLLNHHLLGQRPAVDLRLPRCWYFFGEEVVPSELPTHVRFSLPHQPENRQEAVRAFFSWDGPKPRTPPSKRRKAKRGLDWLHSKYPPGSDIWPIVEEHYAYAPLEFQRHYSQFRSDHFIRSQLDASGSFRAKALYLPVIKRAFESFPHGEFPRLSLPGRKLSLLAPLLLENLPKHNDFTYGLMVAFWETFCKELRNHPRGHSYVPASRLDTWIRRAAENILAYRGQLQENTNRALELLGDSAEIDPMILAFLRPADFGPGTERLSTEIDAEVYG